MCWIKNWNYSNTRRELDLTLSLLKSGSLWKFLQNLNFAFLTARVKNLLYIYRAWFLPFTSQAHSCPAGKQNTRAVLIEKRATLLFFIHFMELCFKKNFFFCKMPAFYLHSFSFLQRLTAARLVEWRWENKNTVSEPGNVPALSRFLSDWLILDENLIKTTCKEYCNCLKDMKDHIHLIRIKNNLKNTN